MVGLPKESKNLFYPHQETYERLCKELTESVIRYWRSMVDRERNPLYHFMDVIGWHGKRIVAAEQVLEERGELESAVRCWEKEHGLKVPD